MGTHSKHSASRNTAVAVTANTNHATVKRLGGFSLREAAGTPAAAAVNIRKGVVGEDNSGDLLAVLEFAANESANMSFPNDGILAGDPTYGIYVEVVSGTVSGVLYHRT